MHDLGVEYLDQLTEEIDVLDQEQCCKFFLFSSKLIVILKLIFRFNQITASRPSDV